MTTRTAIVVVLMAAAPALGSPETGAAQAALDRARQAGDLTVFPDVAVPGRFYYVPGPMAVAERDGRGAVRFLLTRRLGTALTGSSGEVDYFAHLSFDIEIHEVGSAALERARSALAREGVSRPELRRLPLRRTEIAVVFSALGGAADTLPSGDFEAGTDASLANGLPHRTFTLRLDRNTAEAVWRTLESGRSIVSFTYAYVAEGRVGSGDEVAVEGSLPGVRAPLGVPTPPESTSEGGGESGDARAVFADAFRIEIDPETESDLIRVVDLNAERSPPGYGILDVRCYDFRSELRPDLAMKMVELEGVAVNGREAKQLVIFRRDRPDEAVHRVRFPFAVRLDEPLRYRVTEVLSDGERVDLGWQERSWIGVLDASTSIERLEALESSENRIGDA